MLVSITEKCRMNCPHCMDGATEDCNKFMTFDTFKKALRFCIDHDMHISITGGEPTEHPQFWEFLEYACKKAPSNFAISVLTNGMNLEDDNGLLRGRIQRLNRETKAMLMFQITAVPGLYPHQIDTSNPIFHIPDVCYIATEIEAFYPMGRAVGKDYDFSKTKATKCFNFRSIMRSGQGLDSTIGLLRMRLFKFCTPQISYDGYLKAGESTLCPPIASIEDTIPEIEEKIRKFKCDACKEVKAKLPPEYLQAIGEL